MERGESSTSRANREPRNPFDGITPQASASSSAVMKKGPYDVFINHRGCDTKHKLASTIYHTLDLLGLRAFLDEKELELGDSLPDEIQEAMRTAGLHIAIFSERYAESPWCLAELSYMLETGAPILPVFYGVKPDDLRWVGKGKGVFAHAFSQHEQKGRYPSSRVEDWKTALESVSNLTGHVLNSTTVDEGMLLKSIVNSILRVMKKDPLEVAKHTVGMDAIVKDFERSRGKSIQTEEHGQIVGIVGFGGSGKTTLATELYNRKSSSFHRSSFLHDVRDAASKNALHTKQKKLLQDLRIQTTSFDNVREGKGIVEDQLKSLRVLIVLDDVDHEDQLDALLPQKESLGSGSLVIITTREGDVLTKWGITSIYKIKPLQHLHAKQLFCWHAFLQPLPLEGFEDLVENCIDACNGLPLSLKVIGGQLYGKRSEDYWVSQISKIRRILPKEILQRLKVSYDALDEDEQEIFLDIAYFFIGQRKSTAIAVWDGSGWSGLCSWETLHNKCLVEVVERDQEEYIWMHDHLRDLGRQIAKTHSLRRILCKEGMQLMGIAATRDRRVGLTYVPDDFTVEYSELSRGLLWLSWGVFEKTYIPSWLSLESIRVLEVNIMRDSETLWEDSHPPLELRELVIRDDCHLQSFPSSIGRLTHLKRLSLEPFGNTFCCLLSSLPEEFCRIYLLEHLELQECICLSSLPEHFGDLVNLRHLDLRRCTSLKRLPESFKRLKNLKYLNLCNCKRLSSLPNCFGDLVNLQHLDLTKCESLKKLPESFKRLKNLKYLNLGSWNGLSSLPNCFGDLVNLQHLDLSACRSLEKLPESFKRLKNLKYLSLGSWNELSSLPNCFGDLVNLQHLDLTECQSLEMLPESFKQLKNLKYLNLRYCYELSSLPNYFGDLVNLQHLNLSACRSLEKLPESFKQLSSLQVLKIEGCPKLYRMPSLAGLASLNNLEIKHCDKIDKIEGLEHLASLEKLLLWTRWRSCLGATGRLQTLNLMADNVSAFEAYIQSIQMQNWPWEMTISARIVPHALSILDSFTFPGLPVVDSFVHQQDDWNLTFQETNLSNAAVACFLVQSDMFFWHGTRFSEGESTRVDLDKGEWIVVCVFRGVSRLVKDGGSSLHVSLTGGHFISGRLMVGESGHVIEGFKELFQTLCNAAPSSSRF